uniref:DUF4939 domain-containing protein n=1 Tax=Sinocyclocheilus rhinocerous TaxID=307959 RepID=A0A673JLA2_9TELE
FCSELYILISSLVLFLSKFRSFPELVSTFRAALSLVTKPQSASASPMSLPAPFSGEVKFVTERSKVAFLISLLTGQALLWAQAIWESQSGLINSFYAFSSHFKDVFSQSTDSYQVTTSSAMGLCH